MIGTRAFSTGGSIINLSGGTISDRFGNGGTLNMTGGVIGDEFTPGGIVNIAGGRVGRHFVARRFNNVQLIGGEFRLNGIPYSEPTISLGDLDVFSGTLQDGSTYIFSRKACIPCAEAYDAQESPRRKRSRICH